VIVACAAQGNDARILLDRMVRITSCERSVSPRSGKVNLSRTICVEPLLRCSMMLCVADA